MRKYVSRQGRTRRRRRASGKGTVVPETCRGHTRSGSRCKRPPMKGAKFCHSHSWCRLWRIPRWRNSTGQSQSPDPSASLGTGSEQLRLWFRRECLEGTVFLRNRPPSLFHPNMGLVQFWVTRLDVGIAFVLVIGFSAFSITSTSTSTKTDQTDCYPYAHSCEPSPNMGRT